MKACLLALLIAPLLYSAAPLAAADSTTSPAPPEYKANNTGINTRDRQGDMPLPMNQSSSRADTDITANIRKALVSDSALSIDAQNVKVITINGEVTLRGPVKNETERKKVLGIARKNAPGKTVNNHLEISAP